MKLEISIDEEIYQLDIPQNLVLEAQDFFQKMDDDMDQGYQAGSKWLDRPNPEQRCQIVAQRLAVAIASRQERLGLMMAGYLLARLPGLSAIEIDPEGEVLNNAFSFDAARHADNKALMQEIGGEFSGVFKKGKQYRFSSYDQSLGSWRESEPFASEEAAMQARNQAILTRVALANAQGAGE